MERVVPVLRTHSYDVAKAFYVEKLGFEIQWEWRHEPGFPVFMGISKGDLMFFLSEHGATTEERGGISLFVEDIAAWHTRFEETGVKIESGPTSMPWGYTEMLIHDPSGNALCFSQKTPD